MLGIAVAIGAQFGLYLVLRRIAVATMPAWAHGHAHHRVAQFSGPAVVGVALVAGTTAGVQADNTPVLAPPALLAVPLVSVPPPLLSTPSRDGGTR